MYRMFQKLAWVGTASALCAAAACDRAPASPTSSSVVPAATSGAAADGSTLKADPPAIVSPKDDVRLSDRRPVMVVQNAAGRFANVDFEYEFELLSDGGSRVASRTMAPGNGRTTWPYSNDLDRDTPYRWRARAVLDGAFGPWSATGRFFTIKEARRDLPGGQPRMGAPAWLRAEDFPIIHAVASQNPGLLRRSCQEHGGTWEFMDKVVDTLREQRDTRWGYNGKRGNVHDPSKDVLAYHWGPGPDENSTDVYLIDIVLGHCGPTPSVGWNDVTGVTLQSNSIGRWTSRGRF